MLRTYPHRYIEALSPEPRRIVLRVDDKVSMGSAVMTSIRAGVDTFADAFGDRLYFRYKGGKVESPLTGRWIEEDGQLFDCEEHERWLSLSTDQLLHTQRERYFIPRAWNTSGPWITHEDLQKKYDKYIEEKENADK